MSDESYTFEAARVRLEDIVSQVRRKDTSLEKSLDLLEEGVKFVNVCTEQIDHTQWSTVSAQPAEEAGPEAGNAAPEAADEPTADADPTTVPGAASREAPPAGAEAFGDIPSEDAHAARTDTSQEPDPDVEA